jgi:hypothetical protein
MHCGFSWRTPPRRPAFAGRLVVLVLLLAVLFCGSVAPARAYVCAPSSATRKLTAHVAVQKDCGRSPKARPKRGDADPMSFVFFLGIVIVVVLFPVALGRRGELPPE